MPNFYEILGVSPQDNLTEIKKAFFKKSLEFHPDKNPLGQGVFQVLNNIRDTLLDAKKKQQYDVFLQQRNALLQQRNALLQQRNALIDNKLKSINTEIIKINTLFQEETQYTNELEKFKKKDEPRKAQEAAAAAAKKQQDAYNARQEELRRNAEELKRNHEKQRKAAEEQKAREDDAAKRKIEIQKATAEKYVNMQKKSAELKKTQATTANPKETTAKTQATKDLYHAIYNKNIKAVELFLRNGANPNIQIQPGFTALHIAVKLGSIEIVKLLLKHHANVNLQNISGGSTPLHAAVAHKNKEMIKLLLENGAKVTITNNSNINAKGLAMIYNSSDILNLLNSNLSKKVENPNNLEKNKISIQQSIIEKKIKDIKSLILMEINHKKDPKRITSLTKILESYQKKLHEILKTDTTFNSSSRFQPPKRNKL